VVDTAAFFKEGSAALVVIDLQRGIAGRAVAPHSGGEVVRNAAMAAKAFRNANLPVAFVRVAFAADGADALKPLVDEPAQTPACGPDFAEFVPELAVRPADIVITKRNWGAFYGTDLDLQLRRRGATRIAICGISTNIGVESTARDAFERNYYLLFIEDAMASMSAEEHAHSVTRIFPRMGIVRSTRQVLDALS